MKKTLIKLLPTLFFILLASESFAQQDKDIDSIFVELPCYPTDELFKTLMSTYAEKPILLGKTDDQVGSTMSLWINNNKSTWSIISSKGKISCVVGYGNNLNIILRKLGKEL